MLYFLIEEILLLKREKKGGGGGGEEEKQLKLFCLCVFCEYLLTTTGTTSHLISLDELCIFSIMVAFVLVFTNGMEWHSTIMYIIETSVQNAWNTSCMKVWNFFLTTSSYAFYYVSWELLHITLCCDLAMAYSCMKADFFNQFILWKKASLEIFVFCCTDFVFTGLFFLGITSWLI